MLDGASRIEDLISFAKDQNMPGIALTDHGVMYGSVKFYREAKKADIKPVMGCEVYVTADRRDRSRAPYYHLTLLARTSEGYRNLMKLSTTGYLEGFYYKPRVDLEMLKRHGKGLICLSGCLSGRCRLGFSRAVWTRREGSSWSTRRSSTPSFWSCRITVFLSRSESTRAFSSCTRRLRYRSSRPTIPTTRPGATPRCTTCCCVSALASSTPTRTG